MAKDKGNETEQEFMSRLDRDGAYRMSALRSAVIRAGQDGGIQDASVDVLVLSELYYGWLSGRAETEKPALEKMINHNSNTKKG